jgi:dTDP-4-dehydrorhamnose 3,5-epimerase
VTTGVGGLHGVQIRELISHTDVRGSLAEVYRREWFPEAESVVQVNLSRSRAGVLRGMHFHRRQTDYWCFVEGSAFVGLFDLRAGSPSERQAQTFGLDTASVLRGLVIPPGVAHGFYAETDVTLLYLVDRAFDGRDEHGFAWNDPDLPIEWPDARPTVSERDAIAVPLVEALLDPPGWVDPGR